MVSPDCTSRGASTLQTPDWTEERRPGRGSREGGQAFVEAGSGEAKDQAGAECFGMEIAVEDAETAIGELDDAPVEAGDDGVVDAGEELVFEFRAAILAGAKVIVADAAETFQVGHEGQDVRMQGDAGADEAVVE